MEIDFEKKDAKCFRPILSISDKCKAAVVFFLIFMIFDGIFSQSLAR